jgi:hypothetical protein
MVFYVIFIQNDLNIPRQCTKDSILKTTIYYISILAIIPISLILRIFVIFTINIKTLVRPLGIGNVIHIDASEHY